MKKAHDMRSRPGARGRGQLHADHRIPPDGIVYAVEVDAPCSQQELNDLLASVDAVAEIPKAIRAGTTVERAFQQGADLRQWVVRGRASFVRRCDG